MIKRFIVFVKSLFIREKVIVIYNLTNEVNVNKVDGMYIVSVPDPQRLTDKQKILKSEDEVKEFLLKFNEGIMESHDEWFDSFIERLLKQCDNA